MSLRGVLLGGRTTKQSPRDTPIRLSGIYYYAPFSKLVPGSFREGARGISALPRTRLHWLPVPQLGNT